jgi:hypothetical protein
MAIQGFFTGDVKIRDLNGVLRAVNGIVEVASDAGTVTSVGLAVGSTGTDVNVANSPITSSGNITLNLPTASATNRGLLSSTDWAIFSAKQGTITLTTTGNNGSATLTSGTLNIPTYTLAGLGGISLTSLSASSPLLYNNTTGAFSIQVANGSQNGYLSSTDWTTFNSKQSALTFSAPLVNTSGTISIPAATSSVNGYLSSADWDTFNNKQAALSGTGFVKISGTTISYDNSTYYLASNPSSFITLIALSATAPLSYSNTTGVFSISQATTSTDGYLSSTDWNTFNNKQAAGSYITALTGEATASGPGSASVTLSTSAVTGKLLTGLNLTGGGTIAATDSILQAFGKVQNQISGLAGGVTYQGTWNASTNTPTLTSSVGTKGYYYIVDVAGSTNLNGITDWKIGDWAIFNGSTWDKVDNTDAVSSVNGFTGAVSLTTSNIAEGTNLYYLDSRARLALSFTAGSGAYDNTTGVITIPTNTSQLTNGANFITLSSLSASSPLAYNSGTGAFSIQVATGSQNGYLSSTDWATFNGKQNALTLTTTGSSGSATLVGATLNVPTYTLSGLGGVPTSRQLTINGTAYDLSADRSWSVGTHTGSLTSGYIPKATGTTSLADSLVYDAGTAVLIGTTTASTSKFMVYSTTADNHYQAIGSAPSFRFADTITSPNYTGIIGLATASNNFIIGAAAGDMVLANNTTSSLGNFLFGTGTTERMRITPTGNVSINNTNNTYRFDVNGTVRFTGQLRLESTITDGTNTYTLPSATGTLALTSQIPSVTGYVPYTGATANLDLGTHTLIAAKGTFSSSGSGDTVGITHSSGSGIALNITKGGNGEGLYINKTSGSGNAATIIGTLNATTLVKSGGTSSQFLKADGSVDSTSYGTGSVTSVGLSSATSGVTIGSTPITTSGTITLAIATASGSQQGLLSSTDWTTFNNKQNALTNPVTGTGTTNYLPKFTGASTIGNSQVFDNGTNVGIGTATPTEKLDVRGNIYTNATNTNIYLDNGGAGGASLKIGVTGSTSTYINSLDAHPIIFSTTNTERMRLDASGNLGLGVTPSAWGSNVTALELPQAVALYSWSASAVPQLYLGANHYWDGSNWRYKITGQLSTLYYQAVGQHQWFNAPSGTAGNAISFTQAMTLDASGRLGIGTTSPGRQLEIYAANDAYMKFNGQRAGNNAFTIGNDNSGFIVYDDTNGIYRLKIANSTGAATFSSSVTANGGFEIPNGQFYRARRSSGSLLTDMIGIPSGTDDVRILTTGDFNVINGSLSNILTVKNGGNVGIGSTAPAQALTVSRGASSAYIQLIGQSSNLYLGQDSIGAAIISDRDAPMYFQVGASERMRITSGGDVGIGTSSPLQTSTNRRVLTINGTTNSIINIAAGGSLGSSWYTDGSYSQFYGIGTLDLMTGTASPILFSPNNTERMRITSGGLVLFGTTSAPSASVSGFCIEGSSSGNISSSGASTSAYNHLLFYNGNGLVGYISTSGSTTTYSTSSDYRLKQDYKDYSGLELVNKIKTYDYEWKSDKTRGYGVIAHELQSVINYAVTGVKDGKEMQGVDYSKIVPVLIKAVQESHTIIKTLEERIINLEHK